jgi:hypothetical protein
MHIGYKAHEEDPETIEHTWFGKTANGSVYKLRWEYVSHAFVSAFRLAVRGSPGYWVRVPEGDARPPAASSAHIKTIPIVMQRNFQLCAPFALANALQWIGDKRSASEVFAVRGKLMFTSNPPTPTPLHTFFVCRCNCKHCRYGLCVTSSSQT